MKRIKQLQNENSDLHGSILLNKQVHAQELHKEADERCLLLEEIRQLTEKLERKEFFMQTKERKWVDVERILAEYSIVDISLRERFADLRLYVNSDTKIRNVITDNQKLRKELFR